MCKAAMRSRSSVEQRPRGRLRRPPSPHRPRRPPRVLRSRRRDPARRQPASARRAPVRIRAGAFPATSRAAVVRRRIAVRLMTEHRLLSRFPSKQPESGERMKPIVSKAVAGMIVAALACGNALAQGSGAAAEASGPAAAQNASKAAEKAARKSNRKLGYAVRKAISKVNGVNVSNITVRARGGVVTLGGSVPDASQIDKAVEAAKGVAGVVSVNNKLSVQPQ
ncbi:transport-associated domain protein [Burkholderia thailandensis E264]|uniref:Transport-associated domain protein n=3 Tax=Burkholderia thailandensis TaxID=57975 RepID=Q2SYN4_BURTA|nr:transport-associated domain protein [Burkholderia thailandensis E264]